MAWSTRGLADLAGVTVRSIRHWHDVGLLPEPSRRSNGYKQYTARHLVLALRIARLTGLGFSLERVSDMLDAEHDGTTSLRDLRSALDARIADLTRIRADVDELLATGISPDLSPEALLTLEALGSDPGSRNVAIALSRLLSTEDLPTFAAAMRDAPEALTSLNEELLALPADAPEPIIRALADRGADLIATYLEDRPDVVPQFDPRVGERTAVDAVTMLITDQLNAAQHRVLSLIIDGLSATP